MKKHSVSIAAICLAGVLLTSSCYGSFSLFNKLAAWNQKATDSKFLNEILYLVISPAYGVCLFIDSLVLNSIEFWTGDNPIAMKVGTTQDIMGKDGKMYAVTVLRNGYNIKTPTGESLQFVYDKQTKAWSKVEKGQTVEMFRFNNDGTIHTILPTGQAMDVSLNEGGLYQVRMAMNEGQFFAAR